MAHYERFPLLRLGDSPDVADDGVQSFLDFFSPDAAVNSKYGSGKEGYEGATTNVPHCYGHHQKTALRTAAGDRLRRGEYLGTCLLDYVYCWLADGMASLVCPNYEVYLLTVIAIIESYYSVDTDDDELRCLYDAHNGWAFPIYNFGEEGRDHPALRRDVFEFHQRRVLAGQPARQLQRIYEAAVSNV
jgi:hypothetical protein